MLARYGNKMLDEDINRERYRKEDFQEPKEFNYDLEDVYGEDLDPKRSSRIIRSKAMERKHIVADPTQTSIKPGGTLRFTIPKLGKSEMIVPKSFFISGKLNISSTKDVKRSIVPNIGRKLIKKFHVKFGTKDLFTVDYYDEIMTYFDLWLSKKEKARRVSQGIQSEAGLKLRVKSDGAATTDAEEVAISKTLGNRFVIPVDFELLHEIAPLLSSHLDALKFELTFNDPQSVMLGSTDALASATNHDYDYEVNDIHLEYDVITDTSLSQTVTNMYREMIVPITDIQHCEMITIPKNQTNVEVKINKTCNRLSHVLIIAKDPDDRKDFARKEIFKNLDVKSVQIKTYGSSNILYPGSLRPENTYDEALKLFDSNGVTMGEFLTTKYALVLNFRPSTDAKTHGNGLSLTNELQITIERAKSGSGNLDLHVFLFRDGHLNIENGTLASFEV